MAEKPILFSTPMVQVILEGRKTQTRRIVKYSIRNDLGDFLNSRYEKIMAPYQPGDILWVRETWCQLWDLDGNDQIVEGTGKYYYAADNPTFPYSRFLRDDGTHKDYPAWKPSIHMPREAARIFLRVTNVRVERLQEITEEDAKAEGVNWKDGRNVGWEEKMQRSAIDRFRELWDSLNSKRGFGWDDNPWVFVIEFEVMDYAKANLP